MSYNIFEPSEALQGIVKQYVVFNSLDNIEDMLFLPNGGSFVIFNRGITIDAKLFGSEEIYKIPDSYSISFKTNRVKHVFLDRDYRHNDDNFPIVMIELLPIGFYKLFNKDMTLLDFKYQKMEKELIDKYFSKLYTNGTIEDEISYLNNSLLELERSQNNSHLPVEDVVNRIYDDYHLYISVEELLSEFGYSRSTLERHFKKVLGLTPKQFIFISKFCRTILEYIAEKRTLHEIQYLYSDNSHMNAVFKKFLGISPSEIFTQVIDGERNIYQLSSLKLINSDKLT